MSETTLSTLDIVNLIDSITPNGPQPMLAQFNAVSGVFINCISVVDLQFLNTDNFKYVEVMIDTEHQTIKGTYDNFKIVNMADEPSIVYESKINDLCKTKIHKRFTPEVQIDILRKVIEELCTKLGHENEALIDMNEYIDSVKRANKILKQSYIDNPDFQFITIQEESEIEEAKMDGGLHELMGPKNLIGLGLTLNEQTRTN